MLFGNSKEDEERLDKFCRYMVENDLVHDYNKSILTGLIIAIPLNIVMFGLVWYFFL